MKTIRVIIPWIIGNKQKVVIITWIIIVALMSLFPPWYVQINKSGTLLTTDVDYAFFLSPPKLIGKDKPPLTRLISKDKPSPNYSFYVINYKQLWTQVGMVTLIAGGFLLLFKKKDR